MNKYKVDQELRQILKIRLNLKKQPKIYYVTYLIPPFRAMTIAPFGIFIKKEFKGNNQILLHDLIHWKQYERMGVIMYYFRYFIQMLLIGYDIMPMEMEARQFDNKKTKWNYRKRYHKQQKNKRDL